MGSFTVSSLTQIGDVTCTGQCITPSIGGPDGSGTAPTSEVMLDLFTIGFSSSDMADLADDCYLLSDEAVDCTDLDGDPSLIKKSNGSYKGDGLVDPDDGYSRSYTFTNTQLLPNKKYYLYFPPKMVRVDVNSASCDPDAVNYPGGDALGPAGSPVAMTIQFIARFSY